MTVADFDILARTQPLELRGPMLSLYDLPYQMAGGQPVKEILIDSAAGTGKSVGGLSTVVEWCVENPGSRFILYRQTRKSLSESHLVTLDEHVLPAWGIKPPNASRSHRTHYEFPGGSVLVLGGMDNPDKMFSTEYNGGYGGEGNQITLDAYLKLFRCLRWPHGCPFHVSILECNPDTTYHHLVERFQIESGTPYVEGPGRVRWQATHEDNPHYYDLDTGTWTKAGRAYLDTLDRMSGVVRRRLLDGEWAASEGQVFDNFDPDWHVVDAKVEKNADDGFWYVTPAGEDPVRLGWFAAGQDWGFKSPGVFNVWGHGADGVWYMVESIYKSGEDHAWWCEEIGRVHRKFDIHRGVSDPEDAAGISMVNRRLMSADGKPLLMKANKSSSSKGRKGFARAMHMRTMIEQRKVRWVADARNHPPDEDLVGKPKATHEEYPALIWAPPPASRQFEEVGGAPPTDIVLKTNDHGFDADAYMHWAIYEMDLTPPHVVEPHTYRVTDALTQDPAYRRMMKKRGL